jgi:hypothetical protein
MSLVNKSNDNSSDGIDDLSTDIDDLSTDITVHDIAEAEISQEAKEGMQKWLRQEANREAIIKLMPKFFSLILLSYLIIPSSGIGQVVCWMMSSITIIIIYYF